MYFLTQYNIIHRKFEVNVFGSLATIHAFLPLLRQAKGCIVQIGSLTGCFPLPFSGPSSASKAALEAFVDVYRVELKPFGIDFIMVQPGNMLTGGPASQTTSDDFTSQVKTIFSPIPSSSILNSFKILSLLE